MPVYQGLVIDSANPINRSHPWAPDAMWLAVQSHASGAKWRELLGPQELTLGYHGTLTGTAAPPSGTSGFLQGSNAPGTDGVLAFDGTNDYVNVGDKKFFDSNITSMTWMIMFYPKAASPFPGLIGKGDADSSINGSFLLDLSGGDDIGWFTYHGGSRTTLTAANFLTPLNKWWHLTVSWQQNGTKRILLNGTLVNSVASVSTALDATAFELVFGTNEGTGVKTAYPFNGFISDIRFFKNRTFSDSIVKDMYSHILDGSPGLLRSPFNPYRATITEPAPANNGRGGFFTFMG